MMNVTPEIPAISDLTLDVMKRVIDANETKQTIQDENAGPIPLAAALSDFFQLASSLENGDQLVETEVISEIANYSLDLLDRLAQQLQVLDIHDQRDTMAQVFVGLALWFARRDAVIDNLTGTADGFANLVNGENDTAELAKLTHLIQEILEAASMEMSLDEDRSDPWRPWRVLNLNSGIAATRSLDPELMESIFETLGRRLPYDMPGFFADGRRRMQGQNVPDEVKKVMEAYAEKWPGQLPH